MWGINLIEDAQTSFAVDIIIITLSNIKEALET